MTGKNDTCPKITNAKHLCWTCGRAGHNALDVKTCKKVAEENRVANEKKRQKQMKKFGNKRELQ